MQLSPHRRRAIRRIAITTIALTAVPIALGIAGITSHPANHRTTPKPSTTLAVLQLSSQGVALSPEFTTGADWSATFTYSGCAGPFTVAERGGVQDGVPLAEATGGTGIGTTYVHSAPGVHRLQVETGCTWFITVTNGDTLPRAEVQP